MEKNDKLRYDALDGLRAYSAVGIVLMHVLTTCGYDLGGVVFERVIPAFTNLVFLFMVISGFSLCCGYFDKIVNRTITLDAFYSKRFAKVWPFFAVLCLMDFAMDPGKRAFVELLADLSLCFGLVPVKLNVIGVGWFLGLVFVFYFMFPFFCYLLSDKKRAWLAFGVFVLFGFLSASYFGATRIGIAFSAPFFMAGGMIYLYRAELRWFADRFWYLLLAAIAGMLALYFLISDGALAMLGLSILLVIFALRTPRHRITILINPLTKRLSALSMEVYLSHMVIVSLLKKLKLTHLTPYDGLSYALTAVMVLAGAVVFSLILKKILQLLSCFLFKKRS